MFQLESSLEGMNIVNFLLWRGNAYSCNRATIVSLSQVDWLGGIWAQVLCIVSITAKSLRLTFESEGDVSFCTLSHFPSPRDGLRGLSHNLESKLRDGSQPYRPNRGHQVASGDRS
jgi:hypothetical protein